MTVEWKHHCFLIPGEKHERGNYLRMFHLQPTYQKDHYAFHPEVFLLLLFNLVFSNYQTFGPCCVKLYQFVSLKF